MDRERFQKAEEIFHRVVDLDAAEREVAVVELCADDVDLLTYVRRLVDTHESDLGSFMEPGAAPAERASLPELTTPDSIGPYRIVDLIGEGGMGTVYLADQHAPVQRQVAIKVITPGMDTRKVLARFEAERQVLAMMNHSCIARIFDAGATPQGRPYFVMEYIDGTPITSYCDEHRLGIDARLRLFERVCEGVQHAHQRGVIHRDLKPSNVLITEEDGRPQPKIIDFGVAKTSPLGADRQATLTVSGQLIGTLDYMSPEQVEDGGGDIDVRSDVYALGVMLYELLTGVLPIDLKEAGGDTITEVIHHIRHSDPATPSSRLTAVDAKKARQLAEQRSTTLAHARRRLRGDLDWITMKALEKDRERRYQSALELSTEIQRHLRGEPVSAAPPGLIYRSRKLVQRHKARSAFITLGVMVVIAAGIFSFLLALTQARESESRRVALHYEEARALDWHVDDGHLTSFPNAWGDASTAVIARVANRIYAGEANDEELHQFAGAMMRYLIIGSTLQSAVSPHITLTMGGKRGADNWTGHIGALVTPSFEINGEALDLAPRETGIVLLDLGRPDQHTVSFGHLPEIRSRLRHPGSYTIRGEMSVQLVRISAGDANTAPVFGTDALRFKNIVGPSMAFPISPFDFSVVERIPFDDGSEADSMTGASFIDLTHWRAEHYRPEITPGNWALAPDGMSVEQVQHGGVTLFLSDGVARAGRFACIAQVLTEADDDYFGVVFGYRGRDVGYYVFYWKQFGQPTTSGSMTIEDLRLDEGMKLVRVEGTVSERAVVISEPSHQTQVLASHLGRGVGWQDYRRYLIDVDYDPAGTIRLTVSDPSSGELFWDSGPIVDPAPLGAGKIGFFNHSQTNVLYSAYDLPADAPLAAAE